MHNRITNTEIKNSNIMKKALIYLSFPYMSITNSAVRLNVYITH